MYRCIVNAAAGGTSVMRSSLYARRMGGHALKSVPLVRKPRAEYETIAQRTVTALHPHVPSLANVPELPDKADFGDLDLVYRPQVGQDIRALVTQLFRPREISVNGDVTSFDTAENFQVDLIRCSNIPFARFFLSYGDLGGMLGSLVHAHGLKLGQEGMWVRLGAAEGFSKLMLTDDVQAACSFMGVDYNRWVAGITCTQDMYDMVTGCRFFRPDVLATKRADQRPVLKRYLQQVADMPVPSEPAPSAVEEAIRHFKREEELEAIRAACRARAAFASKLNGHMVLALGVPPRHVGVVLGRFREEVGEEWIKTADSAVVAARLAAFVAAHLGSEEGEPRGGTRNTS